MLTDDEWSIIRTLKNAAADGAGSGALRVALLFGALAVGAAIFATPMLEKKSRSLAAAGNVDTVTTGSIANNGGSSTYVVRRSVLQGSADSVCIIKANGSSSGDCP